MIEWLERFAYGSENHRQVISSNRGLSIRRLENSLFLGICIELQQEGWAAHTICCAKETLDIYPPLSLWLFVYGEHLQLIIYNNNC